MNQGYKNEKLFIALNVNVNVNLLESVSCSGYKMCGLFYKLPHILKLLIYCQKSIF